MYAFFNIYIFFTYNFMNHLLRRIIMLNDVDYVQESIAINLYYLRTLREFCLNIQTSLIPLSILEI